MTGGPLWALSGARIKQFLREPGSLFWTFGFPLLITIALGTAFRNQGPAKSHVAVVAGQGNASELAVSALAGDRGLAVASLEPARAARQLARERSSWSVVPPAVPGVAVRLPVRSHPPRCAGGPPAGRRAPAATGGPPGSLAHPRRDRGGARRPLRRLVGAGAARHAAAQRRDVGRRLQHRERPPAQAAQAPGRHAHAPEPLPAVVPGLWSAVRAPPGASSCSRSPASPSA